MAVLCVAAWLLLPAEHRDLAPLFGAAAYLVFCRAMRWILVRDHTLGIRQYRIGHFQESIAHFEASHRFFSAHPRIDAYRSLLFGVASRNSYRVIALSNMAYCYGQLGERDRAIQLFEEVLQLSPGHAVAESTLNLMRAPVTPVGSA